MLDQSRAGFPAAALDRTTAQAAVRVSAARGYLDGRSLAEVFAWLRPTDLIWRYWVNKLHPVLFWNADTTRMAATLHKDMVQMGLSNALTTPGAVRMLGTPVDLTKITVDTYVIVAFQNPRRCRRLVLAATATGALMVPARPSVLTKMLTPRRFVDRDCLASIAATIYGGSADFGNADIAQIVGHQLAAGSRRGYLYQLLAGSVWSSLFALPAIRQPTLIVAGTDDPIIPIINAHIMARLLPHATLHTHPGGHVDLLTNASTLGPIIEDFLATQYVRPAAQGAAYRRLVGRPSPGSSALRIRWPRG
ncbi:alpha/beta fold hydrolase [Rhodococcus wratislaviensis]|uniref:alpha/beta fold hydrolase n=1 Tax=Rhodococcus wratislaviensis TaxID=44752 RepID=UPI0035167F8D